MSDSELRDLQRKWLGSGAWPDLVEWCRLAKRMGQHHDAARLPERLARWYLLDCRAERVIRLVISIRESQLVPMVRGSSESRARGRKSATTRGESLLEDIRGLASSAYRAVGRSLRALGRLSLLSSDSPAHGFGLAGPGVLFAYFGERTRRHTKRVRGRRGLRLCRRRFIQPPQVIYGGDFVSGEHGSESS